MTKSELRMTNDELNLDDSGMEVRFWHWARNVLQEMNEHVTCFVRLNNSIYPAARGAIANVGLLFVTLFHLRPKILQFLGRRFFVAVLARPGKNREHCVRRLRCAHYRITRIRPRDDKSWIIRFAAHCVIACAKRSANDNSDLRHDRIAHRVHELRAATDDPALFGIATDHEPADVLEKNDR